MSVTFTRKGTWSSTAAYKKFDVVEQDGRSYIARVDTYPGIPLTRRKHWLGLARGKTLTSVVLRETTENSERYTLTYSDGTTGYLQVDMAGGAVGSADAITVTASGDLVQVTDAAAALAEELIVTISPVQEGSGDPAPDNVRAITGHTSATVTRTKGNYFPQLDGETRGITYTPLSDGTVRVHGTASSSGFGHKTQTMTLSELGISVGDTLYLASSSNETAEIRIIDANNTQLINKKTDHGTVSFTVPDNASSITFVQQFLKTNNIIEGMVVDEIIYCYLGYQCTSVTVQLGQTVYGCSLDVRAGVLTVTKAYALLNDTSKWEDHNTFYSYGNFTDRKLYNDSYSGLMCSAFPVDASASIKARWTSADSFGFMIQGGNSTYTLDQIKSMASSGDIAICYDLATPLTYQLTANEMEMLAGVNNVWADCGAVSVTYKADTKSYIDQLIAELQAMILENQ